MPLVHFERSCNLCAWKSFPGSLLQEETRIIATLEPEIGRRTARICLIGGLIVAALWIDWHLLPALVWAVILVIATGPLSDRLARHHRALSGPVALPLLFTTAFALIVVIPLMLGVAEAARERADIISWLASARTNGVPPPDWLRHLPFGADSLSSWWQDNLGTPVAASRQLAHLHATAVHQTRVVGTNILHRAVLFAMTLLAYFFLLRDRHAIIAQLEIAGDRLLGATGERVAQQIALSVRGTINGLVFVGLGEGAVMTIVYWVAGVPHSVLLGAVTSVAAMIPFGAVLIFGIAALIVLAQGAALWAAAILIIGLIVVGIADHLVRPALIGGATKLPFLLVLFAILGGVETLGLLGLFVGPAVVAALVMLWREYVNAGASRPHRRKPSMPRVQR